MNAIYEKFSVLISIYYKENPLYFREALESVFSQTILPSEIVLVEDGPLTSALYEIIDEYKTNYPIFKIVKNNTNLGLGLALQKGLLECSNEYVARMDTDDIMPKDRFEKQLCKIKEGYDVVSCWSLLFGSSIDDVIAIKQRPEYPDEIFKLAKRRSPVCHAACFLNKSSVIAAGNYQHCPLYEDYWLWARMLKNGAKFYNVQEVLYYVRTLDGVIQRRGGWNYLTNEIKTLSQMYKIGFFSICDYIISLFIRVPVRIIPPKFRLWLMLKAWNKKL